MKRVVVVGGSIAAVSAVERLKDNKVPLEAVYVFLDDQIPAMRHYFPKYLSQEIKPADVFYRKKDYYERSAEQVFFGKKIERINFKKCRITTTEKELIDYDILILSELAVPQFPDIKGKNKAGVYSADRFADIKLLSEITKPGDIIAIQSDSLFGLTLAKALIAQKKEVMLLINGGWAASFSVDEKAWVENIFTKTGIRFFCNEEIKEVLGDAEVKAIRLKNGKVIECQAILYTDLKPDLRLLADSEMNTSVGIVANDNLSTTIENVFAVDTLIDRPALNWQTETDLYELEKQGEIIASAVSGESFTKQENYLRHYQFSDDVTVDVIGEISGENNQIVKNLDIDNESYCAVFAQNDVIVGAILINDRKNSDKVLRLVKEKDNLNELDIINL